MVLGMGNAMSAVEVNKMLGAKILLLACKISIGHYLL